MFTRRHSGDSSVQSRATGRGLGIATLFATIACAAAFLAPEGASAGQEYFCNGYNAAGYGQAGDRCYAWQGQKLFSVVGGGAQHSACVDAVNGAGNLVASWQCSGGPGQEATIFFYDQSRCLRGVVRNNAPGANQLVGVDTWNYSC